MNRMACVATGFAIILIGAAGCGDKGSPSGSGDIPAGWVKVTIPEGSCEIWMPGEPKRSEQFLENWGGTNYVCELDVSDCGYVASASSVPTPQQAASLAVRGDDAFHLKEARDRVLKDAKAKLISEKAIDYDGHPGWELQYQDPDGFVYRHRQYYIGGQAFAQLVVSEKSEDVTSKEAEAFFQSFRLLKKSGGSSGDSGSGSGQVAAGWVKVSMPEGRCEVRMPAQPSRTVQDNPDEMKNYLYLYDMDVKGYLASATNIPNAKQEAIIKSLGDVNYHLKAARDRTVDTEPGCKLLLDKTIEFRGYPGREFQYQSPDGSVTRVRLFFVGWQIYSLGTWAPKQEEVMSKEAEAFFDSFQMLDALPAGAKTTPSPTPKQRPASLPADGSLFNGHDLTGWGGQPDVWQVQEGAIVGSSFPNGRKENTFLCTEREFRDFELDFDIKLTGDNNSGVMIRSKLIDADKYWTSGIKVDLGGKQAGWGGLVTYDGRNGRVLKPASPMTTAAVKADDFNHVQIKCVGKHVIVTVNDAPVQDTDLPELEPSGVISFQLRYGKPTTIAVKNIRVREVP